MLALAEQTHRSMRFVCSVFPPFCLAIPGCDEPSAVLIFRRRNRLIPLTKLALLRARGAEAPPLRLFSNAVVA